MARESRTEKTETFTVLPHNIMKDNKKELCMKEEWIDIKGYEGLYQVSNLGNVRSLNWNKTKTMKNIGIKRGDGYCFADLFKNGKRHRTFIHRLVASAFLPNPNSFPEVNHKDENPSNNHVENLEWCSHHYNMVYGTTKDRTALKTGHAVSQYDMNGNFVNHYRSLRQAVKAMGGTDSSTIANCAKGIYKQAFGYTWRFEK